MKKRIQLITALIMTTTLVLSGCSLKADEDTKEAQEFINDEIEATEESSEDTAASDSSVIVVKNLFEPVLEEITSSAESSTITADEPEEAEEPVDKVEMVFFGDSQFANGRSDGSSIADMIVTRVPNSVSYNLGIGGTTATLEQNTNYTSPSEITSTCFIGMVYALAGEADRNKVLEGQRDVLETMNKIDPSKVDYYFVEYGANDFFANAPLDASIYETDQMHNFYGALKTGIQKLKEISPNAEIILVTPFYGIYLNSDGSYIGDTYVVSNGIGTLADYARKSGNVADDLKLTPFDTMFMSKCDLYLDTANEYLMDGIHLTLKGRQIFGRLMAHLVNFSEHNEPFAYMDTDFIKIAEYDTEENYRYSEEYMKMYYPESWEKYIKGEFPLAQPSEEALSWDN